VHRGVYELSQEATDAFELGRERVRSFLNADSTDEIIFTRGTTESINLVASCYGRKFLEKGDEVIISTLEHHSNIVPWQMICEERGAVLKVIPIDDQGDIIIDEYKKLLSAKIDGAQATLHEKIDVQELDADFYAFSGHKVYGPTGIGVLYGKRRWLDAMPPYQGGGEMIKTVSFEKTTYNELPFKFEAGTPDISGVIGLGIALEYVKSLGY